MLGVDVQCLDLVSGCQDVVCMLIGNFQEQIKEVMLDMCLFDYEGMLCLVGEMFVWLCQWVDVYIGVFGCLVCEIMLVIVFCFIEILYGFKIMSQVNMLIDYFLYMIEVQFLMVVVLNVDWLVFIVNYLDFVGVVVGLE